MLKGFGGELAKVLASIDCCKYAASATCDQLSSRTRLTPDEANLLSTGQIELFLISFGKVSVVGIRF